MSVNVSSLYFRRDTEYETTAYINIDIAEDRLKLIFIINGRDCYITPEIEGSFIGRVKKFILRAHEVFQKQFPNIKNVCYKQVDSKWKFIKLR